VVNNGKNLNLKKTAPNTPQPLDNQALTPPPHPNPEISFYLSNYKGKKMGGRLFTSVNY